MRISKKKLTVVVAATAVVALGAGSAYAYFTSQGTGTGSASVGTAGPWTVGFDGTSDGPLSPGSAPQHYAMHVTNTGSVPATLFHLTASILSNPTTGEALDPNGNPIHGCNAGWFTASVDTSPVLPQQVAAGSSYDGGTVVISMPSDPTDNQDACEGASPEFQVTAS